MKPNVCLKKALCVQKVPLKFGADSFSPTQYNEIIYKIYKKQTFWLDLQISLLLGWWENNRNKQDSKFVFDFKSPFALYWY
jgi:hypothetical protein